MKNLIDALKILTGRKLSKKEMKRAENEKEQECYMCISQSLFKGDIDNIFEKGDKIIRNEVIYELLTTPDRSYGSRIMHTNYYPTKHIGRMYNSNGLLIRKEVSINSPRGLRTVHKIIVYNKPGQFIGQKSDRYQNLVEAIELEKGRWLAVESAPEIWGYGNQYRISSISSNLNKPLNEEKFG